MRILMITQWFDPEPTFKGLLFARELCAQGHEVEVITGFPNYPGGRLYPGFKMRPWQSKVIDGVRVRRVAIYPSHSGSALGRIANYVSFGLSGTVGALAAKRADVTYLYHPPGTAALAAIVLKIVKRTPFVIDIQDIWPDTLAATGMLTNRRILGFVGWWMRQVYRFASHVVVLSPGFRRLLLERGVPDAKLSVIPNWTYASPADDAPDKSVAEPAFAGRFNVLFAGSMGKAQNLETMLEAAVLLRGRAPEVQFVLLGSGVELDALQAMSRELGLDNIIFLPRRYTDEAAKVLQAADVLLVHLKDDPLFAITLPSKTQAYLQAGKPILMGVRGDAAQLIEEAEAGIAFEPENPEALAAAVETMIAMGAAERNRMGASGRAFYDRRLALPVGVAEFVRLFQKTVGASTGQMGTPTDGVTCETREGGL